MELHVCSRTVVENAIDPYFTARGLEDTLRPFAERTDRFPDAKTVESCDHRISRYMLLNDPAFEEIVLAAPAGSAAFWPSHTWHGS